MKKLYFVVVFALLVLPSISFAGKGGSGKVDYQALIDQEESSRIAADNNLQSQIDSIDVVAGVNGLSCWDLNGNDVADTEEDINNDNLWDAYDCQRDPSMVVPIIWSGYCSNSATATGWNQYCTDSVDFNTAVDHLNINTEGVFTVIIPGYYRINAHSVSKGSDGRITINNDKIYSTQDDHSETYTDLKMDITWPLNEGDTIRVDYYSSSFPNAYVNGGGPIYGSNLQVSFVGPLL